MVPVSCTERSDRASWSMKEELADIGQIIQEFAVLRKEGRHLHEVAKYLYEKA